MKTLVVYFVTAFILLATTSFSQSQGSVFESASLTKAVDGAPYVQLSWTKGVENTAYYLVERSSDAMDFKTVAIVFTGEDSNLKAYKYRDKSVTALGPSAYYRIAIVSEKKEVTYLPVQKVDLSNSGVTVLAPFVADVLTYTGK